MATDSDDVRVAPVNPNNALWRMRSLVKDFCIKVLSLIPGAVYMCIQGS